MFYKFHILNKKLSLLNLIIQFNIKIIIDISVFFFLEKLKKNFKNCLYLNIFLIKTINTIII